MKRKIFTLLALSSAMPFVLHASPAPTATDATQPGAYRSVFTVTATDECGNKTTTITPQIDPCSVRNPLIDTVSLPTDGGDTPKVQQITGVKVRHDVSLIELYDEVAVEPLPTPLLEPDKDGVISTVEPFHDDESEINNPFDPRGIRPLEVAEAKMKVGAIMKGVRPVVIINGRLLQKGGAVEGYTITRIEPEFVILTHTGKFYRLPAGRDIKIRRPKSS